MFKYDNSGMPFFSRKEYLNNQKSICENIFKKLEKWKENDFSIFRYSPLAGELLAGNSLLPGRYRAVI